LEVVVVFGCLYLVYRWLMSPSKHSKKPPPKKRTSPAKSSIARKVTTSGKTSPTKTSTAGKVSTTIKTSAATTSTPRKTQPSSNYAKRRPTYSSPMFAQGGEVGKLFAFGGYAEGLKLDGSYALIDLETSGFNPPSAKILEIAILKIDRNGVVLDEFSTLINPQEMNVGRTDIHRITYAMVKNAPTFAEASGAIWQLINNSIVVAHHARFEENFLSSEFEQDGHELPSIPAIDTLWLARQILDLPDYKLHTVLSSYNEQIEDAHTALGDVRAMAKVLPRMLESSATIYYPKPFSKLPEVITDFQAKKR
jgi:DNA polymerase III epsilon subunit-like protein